MAVQGRTRGVIIEHDPGKDRAVSEQETFTCIHCNAVVQVPPGQPWTSVGGICWSCSGPKSTAPTCAKCAKLYVDSGMKCMPFERRLDEIEARAASSRSIFAAMTE